MDTANLGYCGINCDSCSVRQHGLGHSNDAFIACCASIPTAELKCNGCRFDSVYAGCRTCKIRSCASSRKISHCGECHDFPCRQYQKWGAAAKILPHVRGARKNLATVMRDGAQAWARSEQSRWSCRTCGTPFSWYSAGCEKCGADLTQDAYALTGVRRFLCRIILPKVYQKGRQVGDPSNQA